MVKSTSWLVKFIKFIFYLIFFGVVLLIVKFVLIIFSENKEHSYTEPIGKNSTYTQHQPVAESELNSVNLNKDKGEKQK